MKWGRDRKSGIYESENGRWSIFKKDRKWALVNKNTKDEYIGDTLKVLQEKASRLEESQSLGFENFIPVQAVTLT